MHERLMGILTRQRRRLTASRAAEAAAVGAIASSLTLAMILAGRILAGRLPLAAMLACGSPMLAGVALASSRRLRSALHPQPAAAYAVAGVMFVCGTGALAMAMGPGLTILPRAWLLLLIPAGAIIPAGAAMAAGASLAGVAMDVDRRAGLRERLSTAWELVSSQQDGPFAAAIEAQAVEQASGRLGGIHFWTRTRATAGALGLAILAALLMLPWEPLESPEAARRRRWLEVSARAGQALSDSLAAAAEAVAGGQPALVGEVRRLEELAAALREGRAELAENWRGAVVDLDDLAKALAEAMEAQGVTPEARERMAALLAAVERASAEIVAAMAEDPPVKPVTDVAQTTRPAPVRPAAWVSVYDPGYASSDPPSATAPSTSNGGPETSTHLPFDEAWMVARRRAGESIRSGAVPARYRPLIRDFFAVED